MIKYFDFEKTIEEIDFKILKLKILNDEDKKKIIDYRKI